MNYSVSMLVSNFKEFSVIAFFRYDFPRNTETYDIQMTCNTNKVLGVTPLGKVFTTASYHKKTRGKHNLKRIP